MKRCMMSLLLLTLLVAQASAHFVWIVPGKADSEKATAQVVFSDKLAPDSEDLLSKIAKTELFVRTSETKSESIKWTKGKDAYNLVIDTKGPIIVGGECRYGVIQRGKDEPFLLVYHPKTILGAAPSDVPLFQQRWDRLALEIVPAKDAGSFVVLWKGKPVADAEVSILTPGKDEGTDTKTDKRGVVKVEVGAKGLYGLRVRHTETKDGEQDGKKYQSVRHYATLSFAIGDKSTSAIAPLPKAVSSFGAVVVEGWVYVYGGHAGKTHTYSTETTIGTFHRMKLSEPTTWEELPSGPGVQGLALVAHEGKLYRIGGMQPRNKPGESSDSISVATCARFDPESKRWESLPDMPEGRSSHDAVVVGETIVVAGGWKMNGAGKKPDWHDTALTLDLKQSPMKWQTVKQPFQRRALTMASLDGKAYVIAGLTAEGDTSLAVTIFDPVKNTWTTGTDIPGAKSNGFTPAACVVGGQLYVSAGDGKVQRLGGKGDAWQEIATLKQARVVHRLVPGNGGMLLALGGSSRGANTASVEAISVAK